MAGMKTTRMDRTCTLALNQKQQRRRARRDAWMIDVADKGGTIFLASLLGFPAFVTVEPSSGILYVLFEYLWPVFTLGMMELLIMLSFSVEERRHTAAKEVNAPDVNMLIYGTGSFLSGETSGYHYRKYKEDFQKLRNALVRVLPTMHEIDSDMISVRSHRMLHKWLQGPDSELTLAILEALPRIGTRASLSPIEKLAMGQSKSDGSDAVQRAAIVCLGLLKDRVAEQDTRTLLRPSAPKIRADQLLRPGRAQSKETPETLLRAAQACDRSPREPAHYPQEPTEQHEQTQLGSLG